LGVATGPASRVIEQRLFLDWLLGEMSSRQVDVLIVAGDVFDSMHPSAEALQLYYRFLSRIEGTGVRDVVVVGGNHDSASRLDAARPLLETVNSHVVGGVVPPEERGERMLAPLRARGSDEVVAVCLAVPYVHEYRLGIRTTDLDPDKTRAAFKAEFSALYTELADLASARFPGVPLVATGHLTMGRGSTSEDYPRPIHSVGTIDGLPADILDPRIRYAALGHIHRCYKIGGSAAWYCGTPIPYSITETKSPRQVLVVEVDGDRDVAVERVDVPIQRDLVQIVGSSEVVLAEVAGLVWTTPLPPLVHVLVQTSMAEPGLERRVREAVDGHPAANRPILVEVRQRSTATVAEPGEALLPPLKQLGPERVFAMMCDVGAAQGDDRKQLEAAFQTVLSAEGPILEAILKTILVPSEGGVS
jgi:exonuclease SbcD